MTYIESVKLCSINQNSEHQKYLEKRTKYVFRLEISIFLLIDLEPTSLSKYGSQVIC